MVPLHSFHSPPFASGEDERLHMLCPVQASNIYVDRCSGFSGFSICLNRPCMLFCQIGRLFSFACLVYRSWSVLAQMGLPLDPQGLLASPSWVNLWKTTSRVTHITLVLWIGNGTLRLLPSSSRCRQGPFWQRNLRSKWRVRQYRETMWEHRGGHTWHQPIHFRDSIWVSDYRHTQRLSQSVLACAGSRSLFREQGLCE